jgi:hypothetical protein
VAVPARRSRLRAVRALFNPDDDEAWDTDPLFWTDAQWERYAAWLDTLPKPKHVETVRPDGDLL